VLVLDYFFKGKTMDGGEYFLDQTSLSELVHCIIAVQPHCRPKPPKSLLTPRETEVARPYVKGKSVTLLISRLVAVEAFGDGKALFPTGFVKFFAEYARFRLQNLPNQSKK
jgi:hypothetical protein